MQIKHIVIQVKLAPSIENYCLYREADASDNLQTFLTKVQAPLRAP